MISNMNIPLFVITVCPKCRKEHTVQEVYDKAGELMRTEYQKFVEVSRLRNASFIMTVGK